MKKYILVLAMIAALAAASDAADNAAKTRVNLEDVPAAVRKTIEETAKGGTIIEIDKETENVKVVYEAEVIGKDGKIMEMEVSEEGKLLETEPKAEGDKKRAGR